MIVAQHHICLNICKVTKIINTTEDTCYRTPVINKKTIKKYIVKIKEIHVVSVRNRPKKHEKSNQETESSKSLFVKMRTNDKKILSSTGIFFSIQNPIEVTMIFDHVLSLLYENTIPRALWKDVLEAKKMITIQITGQKWIILCIRQTHFGFKEFVSKLMFLEFLWVSISVTLQALQFFTVLHMKSSYCFIEETSEEMHACSYKILY